MFNDNFKNLETKIIAVIVIINILLAIGVFASVYIASDRAIINDLKNRSDSVYKHVRQKIKLRSFYDLNTRADEQSELYRQMLQDFNSLRESANIKYLYTAKKTVTGEYIYLIDGYEQQAADFRHVGDFIEPEIVKQLSRTLEAGEIVYGNNIQNTEWGAVYVVYYPVFEAGKIIGAVGLEFDANLMWQAKEQAVRVSILVCSLLLLLSITLTISFLKKISYPYLRNLAYTDLLTGVKNRNAFELYLKNMKLTKSQQYVGKIFLVEFDLNNLKLVNDNYGHEMGDYYLQAMSNLLKQYIKPDAKIFRIGGDEFAVIGQFESEEHLVGILAQMRFAANRVVPRELCAVEFSYAYGYAEYHPENDDLIKKVDSLMYAMKEKMKQGAES